MFHFLQNGITEEADGDDFDDLRHPPEELHDDADVGSADHLAQ